MKKLIIFGMALTMLAAVGCKNQKAAGEKSEIQQKVDEYAVFELKSNLINTLSANEKELVKIFIEIGDVMDEIYWDQYFGKENRASLDTLTDPAMRAFANIQYGAWDRLNDEKPFLPGYGERPHGANFYPADMTEEEFAALDDPRKDDQYSLIRRDAEGKLYVLPYHEAYKEQLAKVDALLEKAIGLAENAGLKKYLEARREAFKTDDYFVSDMVWMDMKDSKLDFVVGPIENYDDALHGLKCSHEAFVLVKDEQWSNDLSKFAAMLPEMQRLLPCDEKYKKEVPGTDCDINVYDVVYYAGDCNAGSKTIAINLPNDDRVQESKGTRRLQLRNAMQAKFEKIMMPIGRLILDEEGLKHLKFDAFFWNVTFHEVAHGLGIKATINGKGSVDEAMKTQRSNWEEAKADILGLFLVCRLIEKGEITDITEEDAITTYIAGLFRSVRFGAGEAHGIANAMCFNYMYAQEAFTRDENGVYHINYEKAKAAVASWADVILTTQGDGNFEFAEKFAKENGIIKPEMQQDIDRINNSGIPRDIRFREGLEVLGLK